MLVLLLHSNLMKISSLINGYQYALKKNLDVAYFLGHAVY